MAKYKLTAEGFTILEPPNKSIPIDTRNTHYREYLQWVADGGVPDPADPPSPPTQDELDRDAAKLYTKALKNMTPAEVQTWVDNNINTLADAKDALKTLAVAVSILARRL
jgi:hypothetical protein